MGEQAAETNLTAAFDAVPQVGKTKKWARYRSSILQWVKKGFARALRKRAYMRALTELLAGSPWAGSIRFNAFTQQVEVVSAFPPQIGQSLSGWRPLMDPEDILRAMVDVQENGFEHAGKNAVRDALLIAAHTNEFHPIVSWLESLPPWDGQERMNRLFIDYFPTEIPEVKDLAQQGHHDEIVSYLEETSSCFLVGAIARVFVPGAKVDCLPVLVGRQGWSKSRSVQALVPDIGWFSDDISANLIDRDTKESLCGKFLLELAEFPHLRREVDRVKAFFSRQTDRFRRAYDRSSKDWPRQCTFIATTNELEFVDTTGNRRFWPILMNGPADIAAVERDRDQIWAEALHWYRAGHKWWLAPNLEAIAAQVQEAYLEEDTWDGLIFKWLDNRSETTLNDVLTHCLGYVLKSGEGDDRQSVAGKREQARASTCLKRLGWHRAHRRRHQGERDWIWAPRKP